MAFVFTVAYNLDRPWIKAHIRSLVRSNTGIDIDYQSVRLRVLSGVTIEGVVVRSSPGFQSVAPELARIGRIEAAWSSALFTGSKRRVDRVEISDVVVTVAVDENGQTSFDALLASSSKPNPPPAEAPLSHQLANVMVLAPSLPSIDVRGISLTLVRALRTDHGVVTERSLLEGLALHIEPPNATDAAGEWHLRANLGSEPAPLDLRITRMIDGANGGHGDQSAELQAKLWLTVNATAHDAVTVLDVDVIHQTFGPKVDATRTLHAEARAHFDPAAQKTMITLDKTRLLDGIVTATALLDLPDHGGPVLHHAEARVDVVRLLVLVPPEFVPVRASLAQGYFEVRADEIAVDALPQLSNGAKLAIDGDLEGVKIVRDVNVGVDADITALKIAAHAEPAPDRGLTAHATIAFSAANATSGAPTGRVAAKNGKIELFARDLLVDQSDPFATRGEVTVTSTIGSIDLRSAGTRAIFDGFAARVHALSTGSVPLSLDADVRSALARLIDGSGRSLVNVPLHIDAKLADVLPDKASPKASRGKAKVVASAGDAQIQLDATKSADAVDYTLDANARTLAAARPFLPKDVAQKLPVERMALAIRSRGRASGIASRAPSIEHHTEVRLARPSYDDVSARAIALVVSSKGTAMHHDAKGNLRLEGLAAAGVSASDDHDDHVAFSATLDRGVPKVFVHLDATGRLRAKLSAAFGFDRARRALTYDVDGEVDELAPLAPFASKVSALDGVRLSRLEMALSARGALTGVVAGINRDGSLRFEPTPTRSAGGEGTIHLRAKNVAWKGADLSFSVPSIAIESNLHGGGSKRTIDSHVLAGELRVSSGIYSYDIAGLNDTVSITLDGDLLDPEISSQQTLTVSVVKQDIAPAYPVGDATMALALRRSRDGVVRVSNFEIKNGAGGTSFALKGAMDTTEDRRRLSLRGELHQDLARLSTAPGLLSASGNANVNLRVESPDFVIFRTVADVRIEGANIRLPASGVVVEDANGEVPITVSVRVSPRGIRIMREDQDNPYSSLRYTDQHPLLSKSSFLSIRNLLTPQVSISPFVGNLQIEQNLFSLHQFEMGIRGGRVTGRCELDWNGAKSTLNMNVRADGVQSSHGEPFTGNAALVVSAADHNIEGRVDVLQIGKRHLLDLLDLHDPFHADASVNKLRSAMRFGYPDKLRVSFNRGFASVHVTLGGLARFIRISDLRGIPIGPVLDQFIPPFVPSKDDP
ncbi:MAG: hypothetical protein FWD73_03175 [Polyangiaceae bacterium]|nr:hypothetical protein [Polyangiaceae bacterium]